MFYPWRRDHAHMHHTVDNISKNAPPISKNN